MLFHLDKSHTAEEFSLFLTLVKSPISSLEPSTLSSSVSMSVWQKDLDLWSSEVLWKERQERLREAVKETMRQYKMACKASQKPLSLNGCFSGHKQAISFLHWQQVCVLPKITFCILKAIVQYHTEHMILADVVEAWFKSMFGRAILETEKHIYCEQSNSFQGHLFIFCWFNDFVAMVCAHPDGKKVFTLQKCFTNCNFTSWLGLESRGETTPLCVAQRGCLHV